MEQLYIKLNDLMVKGRCPFEYVYDVTYTPYKLSLPMEQYLNAALQKGSDHSAEGACVGFCEVYGKTMLVNRIRVWIPIHRNIIMTPQSVI